MSHKTKKTITLIYLLLASSIVFAQNFKIDGTAEDLRNGTWLYLKLSSTQKIIDSSQVTSGKFTFNGQLPEPVMEVELFMKKSANYVFFWLENKDITISVKDKQFKKGEIKGSDTEFENREIQKIIKPIRRKEDSVAMVLRKATDTSIKVDLRKQIANIKDEEYNAYLNYAKSNPNSLILAYATDVYSTTWGKKKRSKFINCFHPNLNRPTMEKI